MNIEKWNKLFKVLSNPFFIYIYAASAWIMYVKGLADNNIILAVMGVSIVSFIAGYIFGKLMKVEK